MLEPPNEDLRRRAKQPVGSKSHWDDAVWKWDGGTPGNRQSVNQIRWDFPMADGSRFNDAQWAPWAEAMKTALWSLVADPPADRRPLRITSLGIVHRTMRILVQWMHDNGYERLNQLTRTGQRAFIRDMRRRRGSGPDGKPVKNRTLAAYQDMLQLLFLQGRRYPELAIEEPAPQDTITTSRLSQENESIPRTPDAVANALIGGAIRLLGPPAEDIIVARDEILKLEKEVRARKRTENVADCELYKILKDHEWAWKRSRNELWYREGLRSPREIRRLTDRLCDAAFVVLSYLVGMRVSEILGLEPGCITQRRSLDGSETFTFVTGRIYKTAPTAQGVPHEWVAPPIVERAIEILERISLPLRERTGQRSLWLNAANRGVTIRKARITVLTRNAMSDRLNIRFSPFVGVPPHEGKPWRLSPHQGRKTFAYFVARQDRSGLHALKEHLGHRSIVMTDQAYSGRDHEMTKLIGEAATEEMVSAFAEVLTASELAGQAGEEIAKRSPFRGQIVTQDALEYARQRLRDTGLRFEVCDYGYCYYNARHSACHGDEHGPNLTLRTQSACVGCTNFVAGPKHLPVWKERQRRYEAVFEHTEMAPEAASAVQAKIAECKELIQNLEKQQAAQ